MSFATLNDLPAAVIEGLEAGTLAPYLGPGLLALCSGSASARSAMRSVSGSAPRFQPCCM